MERGNVFYTLTDAETDKFIKASAPLYEQWVADMDKRGLPGKQMLEDARGLVDKYKN